MIKRNPFRDTSAFLLSLEHPVDASHDNVATIRHMIRAYINRTIIRPKSRQPGYVARPLPPLASFVLSLRYDLYIIIVIFL